MKTYLLLSSLSFSDFLDHTQDLVKNWADVFGSPSEELKRLGITANDSQSQLPSNIANMLISKDRQLRGKQEELDQVRNQFSQDIHAVQEQMTEKERAAHSYANSEISEVTRRYEKEISELKRQLTDKERKLENTKAETKEQLHKSIHSEVHKAVQTEAGKWESANQGLRRQLNETTSELQRVRNELQNEQNRSENEHRLNQQAIDDLKKKLEYQKQAADNAAKSAAQQVEECRYKYQQELQSEREEFANTIAAKRVKELENKARWLANRVLQLQRLADSLQAALAREMGLPVATETLKRLKECPESIDEIVGRQLPSYDPETKQEEPCGVGLCHYSHPQCVKTEGGTLSNGHPPESRSDSADKKVRFSTTGHYVGWVEPGPFTTPTNVSSTSSSNANSGERGCFPVSTAYSDRPKRNSSGSSTRNYAPGDHQARTNSISRAIDEALTGLNIQSPPLGDTNVVSHVPSGSVESFFQGTAVHAMQDASHQARAKDPVPLFWYSRHQRHSQQSTSKTISSSSTF